MAENTSIVAQDEPVSAIDSGGAGHMADGSSLINQDELILMIEETTPIDAALRQANRLTHLVSKWIGGMYSIKDFRKIAREQSQLSRMLLNAIGYRVKDDGTLVGPDEE